VDRLGSDYTLRGQECDTLTGRSAKCVKCPGPLFRRPGYAIDRGTGFRLSSALQVNYIQQP